MANTRLVAGSKTSRRAEHALREPGRTSVRAHSRFGRVRLGLLVVVAAFAVTVSVAAGGHTTLTPRCRRGCGLLL